MPVSSKNTESDAISEVNAAITIANIKETEDNPVEILTKYAKYADVDESSLYLINSILGDSNSERINNLLKSSNYSNAKQLNAVLKDNLLLMAINSINSNNHIKMKDLLALYKNELGFDAAAQISAAGIGEYNTMQIYRGLIDQNFASLQECRTKFNTLLEQYKQKATPTGGNVGGASGGSGGSSVKKNASVISGAAAVPASNAQQEVKSGFSDINGHWAKESIVYLFDNGFVNGKDGMNFCPEDSITREEFIKILILALGLKDESASASFTDVPVERWSYIPVASAYKLGIVQGYPDGSFGAYSLITREDMAVMIFRAMETSGKQFNVQNATADFADSTQISGYAADAVDQLHRAGIVNGAGNNEFMPKNNATRAEAAQMIYNLIG